MSLEKAVKGATKANGKLNPPKSKYLESILVQSHGGEASVAEIFRSLSLRLKDTNYLVVFKGLIVVHVLLREGEREVTASFLSKHPKVLAIPGYVESQRHGRDIRHYESYLLERCRGYRDCRVDFARDGEGRLKRLTVDKGLLRETESVQNQIEKLIKCDFLDDEPENDMTIMAFRLVTLDLLKLFNLVNEAIINLLEHYFELSKPDAERALAIYQSFASQTGRVIKFLTTARHHEVSTRIQVPRLKHAPLSLAKSLEEYLHDPDFEINRRQYLAQQEARRTGKKLPIPAKSAGGRNKAANASPDRGPAVPEKPERPTPKAAPDLIDFFASIESGSEGLYDSQPLGQQMPGQQAGYQAQPQVTGFQQHQQAGQPFGQDPLAPHPLSTQFSDLSMSGYTSPTYQQPPQMGYGQQLPQQTGYGQQQAVQPQQTGQTNPFRQTMLPPQQQQPAQPLMPQRTSTNPFASSTPAPPTNSAPSPFHTQQYPPNTASPPPFMPPPSQQNLQSQFTAQPPVLSPPPMSFLPTGPFSQPPAQPGMMQPQATGSTNPFAKPQQQGLSPQQTGTNPFRQSVMPTGQSGGAGVTMGGMSLDQMSTMPLFPRGGGGY